MERQTPGSWPRFRVRLAFATSLLRDRALAEDVTHDCYVRLLARAETYDLPRDGTKLLYKAITNACIDKNYRDRRMVSLEAEALGEIDGHTDRCTPSGAATPTSWPPATSWKRP